MSEPRQIELTCGKYGVVVADAGWDADPTGYPIAHHMEDEKYRPSSWHRVTVTEDGQGIQVCLLLGGGGASGVHSASAVCVGGRCYVAVGDSVCALSVPTLSLVWRTKVDPATCFGVYHLPEFDCLISHGELEITRLDLAGSIAWQTSGRDIFSEGISLHERFIDATDFEKMTYRIDIDTGRIAAELPSAPGA